MTEGHAELSGSAWSFLIVGASYQKIFFRSLKEKRWADAGVLASGERATAYQCPVCSGMFIVSPPWTPGFK